MQARLGGEDIGYGFRRDLKLISEVQAPFRGVRRFFYVALSAAAGISLFFTLPRLYHAINGGDGAPDLWETAGNAAINLGGKYHPFGSNFHFVASFLCTSLVDALGVNDVIAAVLCVLLTNHVTKFYLR